MPNAMNELEVSEIFIKDKLNCIRYAMDLG